MCPANEQAADEQATFAAALLDPSLLCPSGLRAWNGSDPLARLAVHRNNVVSSLIDALADTFPVVQQLVGEDFFRAMAGIFVRQSPPQSQVLSHYGLEHPSFPTFVAHFPPAQELPYLADVALLEAARVRAYHAADSPVVSAEAVSLALSCGERAGELLLGLHPSLFTMTSDYAVASLWAAHQIEGEVEPLIVDTPESIIVLRAGLEVLVLPASPGGLAFVRALQQGRNLGDAAAGAADAAPDFDVMAALSLLLAHDALTSIHLPPRPAT